MSRKLIPADGIILGWILLEFPPPDLYMLGREAGGRDTQVVGLITDLSQAAKPLLFEINMLTLSGSTIRPSHHYNHLTSSSPII